MQAQFANSPWNKMFLSYRISSAMAYVSFFGGLAVITFLVFIQHDFYKNQLADNSWDVVPNMLYNAFARSMFVVGLTLIILPTFEGRLPWIKSLLANDTM